MRAVAYCCVFSYYYICYLTYMALLDIIMFTEFDNLEDVRKGIARRARARRLTRGWTQAELAERAGLALPTLKKFEHTGLIALERLVRIAAVLDDLAAFTALFAPAAARSLDELEARVAEPTRKYGRRRANGTP